MNRYKTTLEVQDVSYVHKGGEQSYMEHEGMVYEASPALNSSMVGASAGRLFHCGIVLG